MSKKSETERDALRRWMGFAISASGLGSANKLARAAGLSQTTVTRFINGHTDFVPTRSTIEKLAAAARIDPPKQGDWEASAYSALTEDVAFRGLVSESVRLADRFADEAAIDRDPVALRKHRQDFLPRYVLLVLDCMCDLHRNGRLNKEAVAGIETMLKRVAINSQKAGSEGNALSLFRDSAEPQRSSDPQSETSDTPLDEPAKKAAAGDTDTPPLAA